MSQTNKLLSNWLREPLFHFVVLAAFLFLIDYLSTGVQKDRIVVSKATAKFLVSQREELELRSISVQEQQVMINQYINDEILYREAYKRGLDRSDTRMRRNLIRKMRSLLAGEINDPTSEQLRAFYLSNRERFLSAETWSFEQVFFSDAALVPDDLLAQLQDKLDPQTVGEDRFNLHHRLSAATQRDLTILFGADSTRSLLAIGDNDWQGPLESKLGIHFLRLTGHIPPVEPPYESVAPYLEGEWRIVEMENRVRQELTDLREQYQVIIESQDAGR